MPELPEVEVTRLGLLKRLKGGVCSAVTVRETRFRYPLDAQLAQALVGRTLRDIERRSKYLIWDFTDAALLTHLGMSGVIRVVDVTKTPVDKHDHLDIAFGELTARYHDPRRFGFVRLFKSVDQILALPEIERLGVEPFSPAFNAEYLKASLAGKSSSIKEALLSGQHVVGLGNIYCSEALFLAGIRPTTAAGRISLTRLQRLVDASRQVLREAIAQGGSTLRDFVSAEGKSGYFTIFANVYGRTGEPCRVCGTPIAKIKQGQRATYYCPKCQH